VSRNVARSAFDSTAGGRHLPQPVTAACTMTPLYRSRQRPAARGVNRKPRRPLHRGWLHLKEVT
jgi:hypothetical protein